MSRPSVIRLILRSIGLVAMLWVLLSSPLPQQWENYVGAVAIFFIVCTSSDQLFERHRNVGDEWPIFNPPRFGFPAFTDEDIRNARIRSFVLGAIIAVLPAAFNGIWRWFDSGTVLDDASFKQALPDFAIAGVGITISAFTNTVFSIARLNASRGTGTLTFSLLVAAALCAFACFAAYVKATHALIGNDIPRMFYSSLALAICSFVLSYAAVASYVSDELRGARELRHALPDSNGRKDDQPIAKGSL